MFCLNIHQTSHFFLLFVVADVIRSAACSVSDSRVWKVKHESRGRRALVRYGHFTSVRFTDLLVQPVVLPCLAPWIGGESCSLWTGKGATFEFWTLHKIWWYFEKQESQWKTFKVLIDYCLTVTLIKKFWCYLIRNFQFNWKDRNLMLCYHLETLFSALAQFGHSYFAFIW